MKKWGAGVFYSICLLWFEYIFALDHVLGGYLSTAISRFVWKIFESIFANVRDVEHIFLSDRSEFRIVG